MVQDELLPNDPSGIALC